METWAQHYQGLYSKENSIINAAVENTKHLTNHGRTRCPTIYQIIWKGHRIPCYSCKAPAKDGIHPKVVKTGKDTCTILLRHLHELLIQIWTEGTVPRTYVMPTSFPSTRTKDLHCSNHNYHRISLLGVVVKASTRVVLNRLQKLVERVYPEATTVHCLHWLNKGLWPC